jgi:MFS family permease
MGGELDGNSGEASQSNEANEPAKAHAQTCLHESDERFAPLHLDPPDASVKSFPKIIQALRNPNFRLFWGGNFLSNIGTWMQNVAQGWLILDLTHSAFWLGVVGFAGSIPFLFITLFGGVVADRVNKRKLLLTTQSAMMLLAFLLAGLTFVHRINVWGILAIAFFNGVAMAMNAPSYQALVPQLIEREDLTNAIALNSAQFNMSRILGPTLGGYAMALIGVAGNFFLNGISFLAVLVALVRIKYPEDLKEQHASMMRSLVDGFKYLHSQAQMRVLVWMIAAGSLFGIPFITFIPYFARIQLHTDESGLGWLMAFSGAGAVMGAVTVAAFGKIHHRGYVIAISGIFFFSAIIGVCYSLNFHLSAALLLLEGYSAIMMISSVNIGIQQLSSNEMRGRVMSIYATCFLGLPPLGSLLAGELSRHIPTSHALGMMAGLAALVFAAFLAFSRQLRSLE